MCVLCVCVRACVRACVCVRGCEKSTYVLMYESSNGDETRQNEVFTCRFLFPVVNSEVTKSFIRW